MTIIQDTREQKPWTFDKAIAVEVGTLETGDYTLKGFEHLIRVERKGSVDEIANNLVKEFARFEKEMIRMLDYKHRHIVCEFSYSDLVRYPLSSRNRKYATKISGKFLLKRLCELQIDYGVNVVFCDNPDGAALYTTSLFKRIYDRYRTPKKD